ncbi:dihydroorotase [Breoghania corrubedonensis]|uniref:Dihydroorotase n=1 Tax=Breoghania corrubedonensis TaxID=665038 RepID=A0A2T5VCI1_9HYPH|nr:dihydroorotase [Breoghania corrubedonensis]PTW61461.1 dihydroorotase [Breoghania corrubedonensis]
MNGDANGGNGTPAPVVFSNARIVDPARDLDTKGTVIIADGVIQAAGPDVDGKDAPAGAVITDCGGKVVAPGLIDMRVFVGEPGHEHRETLRSASKAAAVGGVTTIITMPDTEPVIDEPALVDYVLRRARDTAIVRVHPAAALTKGLEGTAMTEIGMLKEAGAVAFTDGRHCIANARVMQRLMTYANEFGALVMHHPQDANLSDGGVMNMGETASRLGLMGVPLEAEIIMLERDLRLAAMTGAAYHAAQISCGESAEIVRAAKAKGHNVTAGVSINHLTLNENDIGPYRTFFKMSPPLRLEDDRRAMVEAVRDGIIDVIVSSHDPQDVETKRHPFAEAADGAIGLETLLPAALRLVHSEDVPLMTVLRAMTSRPAQLLGLDTGTLKPGAPADVIVFDPDTPWVLAKEDIVSRSKNSPFEDARFQGRVLRTLVAGRTVHPYSG